MDRKKDPQKIDFWRLLNRDRVRGGGVCGPHLALEFEDIVGDLTRCAPTGAADDGKRASSTIDVAFQSVAYRGVVRGGAPYPTGPLRRIQSQGVHFGLLFGVVFLVAFLMPKRVQQ